MPIPQATKSSRPGVGGWGREAGRKAGLWLRKARLIYFTLIPPEEAPDSRRHG